MNLHEIKGPVIRTFTGELIDVFDPDPDLICIEDIAHALSNLCRWGGHTRKFYSVAEHSILCSRKVPWPQSLAALLHDASEAYLVDVPSPIKHKLSEYKAVEDGLMKVIAKKFGFEYPLHVEVKAVDKYMLEIEYRDLMLSDHILSPIEGHSPELAKRSFLEQFNFIQKLTTIKS